MAAQPSSESACSSGGSRKINFDGTVNICCRDCGRVVLFRQPYRGYSSVVCDDCQKRAMDQDYMSPDTPLPFDSEHPNFTVPSPQESPALNPGEFKAAGSKSSTKKVVEIIRQRISRKRRRITQD